MMEDTTFQFETTNTFKKAALVLHGLTEKDQLWILSHLPEKQSKQLTALLIELKEIGIESNGDTLRQVLSRSNEKFSSSLEEKTKSNYEKKCMQVDRLNSDIVSDFLSPETDEIIALALAVNNWAWAAKYLSSLPVTRRDAIRKLIKEYVGNLPISLKNSIADYFIQKAKIDSDKSMRIIA